MQSIDLHVDSPTSIYKVQDAFSKDFDYKSVAQELIQNSLDENQTADLSVRHNLILLKVNSSNGENVKDIERKVSQGIDRAKRCLFSKKERIQSLEDSQKQSQKHGRGFFLMLCLGWDIVTIARQDQLLIAAIKT